MIYWVVSIASLIAVVINIKKHVACFYIWAVTNAIWAYADFTHGIPSQGVLQLTYFVLAIYGIWAWKKQAKSDSEAG